MKSITKLSVVEKILKANKIKTTEHLKGDDERPENAKKDVYTLLSVYYRNILKQKFKNSRVMNKDSLIEDIAWLVAYYVVNGLPIPQDLSDADSPEVSGNELASAKAKNIFKSAKNISAEQAFRWIAEIYSVSFLKE